VYCFHFKEQPFPSLLNPALQSTPLLKAGLIFFLSCASLPSLRFELIFPPLSSEGSTPFFPSFLRSQPPPERSFFLFGTMISSFSHFLRSPRLNIPERRDRFFSWRGFFFLLAEVHRFLASGKFYVPHCSRTSAGGVALSPSVRFSESERGCLLLVRSKSSYPLPISLLFLHGFVPPLFFSIPMRLRSDLFLFFTFPVLDPFKIVVYFCLQFIVFFSLCEVWRLLPPLFSS